MSFNFCTGWDKEESEIVCILKKFYGKRIVNVIFEEFSSDPCLKIYFEDGSRLFIGEYTHQCCEERYTSCDDSISSINFDILNEISIKEVSEDDCWGMTKEIKFIEIRTAEDFITLKFYNTHNGYYSGFDTCFEGILV